MKEDEILAIIKKNWKNGAGKVFSAQGALGGFLTWWDSFIFKFRSVVENRHWLFVELENIESHKNMRIGNIYGPTVNGSC